MKQTPEEGRASMQRCGQEMRALRIQRRRCVACNTRLFPEAHHQKCEACAHKNIVACRAWAARRREGESR